MKTLKVLGTLLTYPSAELVTALPEFQEILKKETWLPDTSLQALNHLMAWMKAQDILDLQEEFVALFDRTPSLCLHLFEHIHGDSRNRGQALVDLSGVYMDVGLLINTEEMPDYLPLFLEYLSIIDAKESSKNLGEIANILGVLAGRLKNRQSPYVAIFDALIEAAANKPDAKAVNKALAEAAGKSSSFDDLDKVWEEQNAFENSLQTTGQDMDAGCPKAEEMLARANLTSFDPIAKFDESKEV
ncbi:MAG: nitrate reductase molybdenum cofactor assembly chaperone [Alphaproteobacteria bacterium]|nr:nitrate reductase molybdenum cofactor assembly chaperone [Alphaproteobacteria bacterium]